MGKGGIVFYFWGADATEKGSLGPNTVFNSNQINSGLENGELPVPELDTPHTTRILERTGVVAVPLAKVLRGHLARGSTVVNL